MAVRNILLAALLLLLAVPPCALAQDDEEAEVLGDPHRGYESWEQPRPTIQAEQDPSLRPAGTGAIFVPSMTESDLEPFVIIRRDGEEVATSPTGKKIFVTPGVYDVFVGTGTPDTMLEYGVNVVEGRITFIPVEWGGLVVRVVDERGNAFRGTYDLVTMPEREYVGIGLGAVIREGEQLTTWLLPPGDYMILAAGESYQARKNFVTLRIDPGHLVNYTLVLDESTGDLLGAGDIRIGGTELDPENNLSVSLVAGGRVEFNNASDVIGKNNGAALSVTGFLESIVSYIVGPNILYGRLSFEIGGRIEFGILGEDTLERPFVPNIDEIIFELLYVYQLADWFGPYVRFTFESNMLPGVQDWQGTSTRVQKCEGAAFRNGVCSGRVIDEFGPGGNGNLFTDLNSPFAPIEMDFGTGGRFAYRNGTWLNISARLGFGGRQVFPRDLYVIDDDTSDPVLLSQRPPRTQFGFEAAIIAEVNITRWVLFKIDANLLDPFVSLPNEDNRSVGQLLADPVLDFRGTLALRLSSIASINYVIRVISDSAIQAKTQVDQSVLLRFAYKIL